MPILAQKTPQKKRAPRRTRSNPPASPYVPDRIAAASRAVNITQVKSCNTPDSIMEDSRGRGERRISVDQVIEDLLINVEVKCQFMWRYAEPHIGAIEPGKAAEFRKRAAQCKGHFARLVKLLELQS